MKSFIMLLCALAAFTTFAQDKIDVASPQVSDFMRYNTTSVTKHTGRLDLSIPLATVSDNDFKIPIALGYNSAGFFPEKNEGIVGFNWFLNVGGVITREVHGIPDDLCPTLGDIFSLLHVVKDKDNYHHTDEQIKTFSGVNLSLGGCMFSDRIEAQPDIYSFYFLGYSGKFIIGYDGNVKVSASSSGNFKVDLSEYNYNNALRPERSTIKITTDNGYIYHFGGEVGALEYTVSLDNGFAPNGIGKSISSFHLSKIEAPNGRTLYIDYMELPNNYTINEYSFPSQKQHFLYTSKRVCSSAQLFPRTILKTLTKIARIKQIRTDQQIVKFEYSDRKSIYDNLHETNILRDCGAKLDRIVQYDANEREHRRISFHYGYYGGTYSRLFLDSLEINNKEKYNFSYNMSSSDALPIPITANVDYWGFWNSTRLGAAFIPDPPGWILDVHRRVCYTTDRFEPSGTLFDKTLLKHVKFPTGGTLDIAYELHTYSQRMERSDYSDWLLKPYPISGVAGGARVKSLTESDGVKTQMRFFEYFQDLPHSRPSTGLLHIWPIWNVHPAVFFSDKIEINGGTAEIGGAIFPYNPSEKDHVTYSQVKEIIVDEIVNTTEPTYVDMPLHVGAGCGPLSSPCKGEREFNLYRGEQASWTIRPATTQNITGNIIVKILCNGGTVFTFSERASYERRGHLFLGAGQYTIEYEVTGNCGATIGLDFISTTQLTYNTKQKFLGPYTISHFSTNPDELSDITNYTADDQWVLHYCGILSSREVRRGRLLREEKYRKDHVVVQENEYTYEDNLLAGTIGYGLRDMVYVLYAKHLSQAYTIPLYPYNLIRKKTATYDSDGAKPIVTTVDYKYNSFNQLETATTVNSEGSIQKTTYKYATDSSTVAPYNEMCSRNMVSRVVEQENFTGNSRVYTYRNSYARFNNVPLISSVRKEDLRDISLSAHINYPHRDRYGNPGYVIKHGVMTTVYIWSYMGQYPIAEIQNTTYEEVMNALGCTSKNQMNDLASQLSPNVAEVDMKLRQYFSGRPTLITTYTYQPLVGMTSATDPRGVTTYYEYDSFGWLQYERDHSRNIIKAYDYNYVNK